MSPADRFQTWFAAKIVAVAAFELVALTGCSPLQYLRETQSVDATGAFQITDRDVVEDIDLESLLDSYAPRKGQGLGSDACDVSASLTGANAAGSSSNQMTKDDAIRNAQTRLNRSLANFNCRVASTPDPEMKKLVRNSVQERLLAASQQRCNAFKTNLQREFARTNFGLGVLSTIAGTAGALSKSAAAAANWSGGAAVFSGVRAEYNQDYMANLAAHVITEGIDKRRQAVYDQIQRTGQSKDYASYPVDAAIKDAFYYHGQCGVLAGFQEASDAIKYANDPGLNTAIMHLARWKVANAMLNNDKSVDVNSVMKLAGDISATLPSLVGSKLQPAGQKNYSEQFFHSLSRMDQANRSLSDTAVNLLGTLDSASKLGRSLAANGANIPAGYLSSTDRSACQTRIVKRLSDEQAFRSQITPNTPPGKEAEFAGSADTEANQGKLLSSSVSLLAESYVSKATSVERAWKQQISTATDEAKSNPNTKLLTVDLAEPAPTLDSNLLGVIRQLCK